MVWLKNGRKERWVCTKKAGLLGVSGPRQGLNQVARQGGGHWPARRGGDFRSHRKPAGAAPGNGGLPVKARLPPKKYSLKNQNNEPKAQCNASATAPCPPLRLLMNFAACETGKSASAGQAGKPTFCKHSKSLWLSPT